MSAQIEFPRSLEQALTDAGVAHDLLSFYSSRFDRVARCREENLGVRLTFQGARFHTYKGRSGVVAQYLDADGQEHLATITLNQAEDQNS